MPANIIGSEEFCRQTAAMLRAAREAKAERNRRKQIAKNERAKKLRADNRALHVLADAALECAEKALETF